MMFLSTRTYSITFGWLIDAIKLFNSGNCDDSEPFLKHLGQSCALFG